jgi:hypothetical protein
MQEKPNLTASQTTRIASLLLHSAQDRLWPAVDYVLGPEHNTEVNDADITRIFNALKALI